MIKNRVFLKRTTPATKLADVSYSKQAKEYQDRLLPFVNEHVTKYYNDMANGYEPNISLYINDRR